MEHPSNFSLIIDFNYQIHMFAHLLTSKEYNKCDFFHPSDKCLAVANFFIQDALEKSIPISRNKVLNLTSMALGLGMATLNKEIFPDRIEAWPQGPATPALYLELDATNPYIIQDTLATNYELPDQVKLLLGAVNRKYGEYSAEQLASLHKKPNTPWTKTKRRYQNVIDRKLIKQYYKRLLDQTIKI